MSHTGFDILHQIVISIFSDKYVELSINFKSLKIKKIRVANESQNRPIGPFWSVYNIDYIKLYNILRMEIISDDGPYNYFF